MSGGGGGRKAGGVEGVKEQLYVFPVFCGLVTKEHIFDSELTHSSDLDRCKVLFS